MNTRKSVILIVYSLFSLSIYCQWTQVSSGTSFDLKTIEHNFQGALFCIGNSQADIGGILIRSNDQGVTWSTVFENGVGFSDIDFPSFTTGYLIPNNQDTILISNNAGNTWMLHNSPLCNGPNRGFVDVCFSDSLNGYAPGYKTSNGGLSWALQFEQVQNFPFFPTAITKTNDQTILLAGYDYWGGIAKSIDGGENWYWVNDPYETWEIYSLDFPSETVGYATGYKNGVTNEAEILKTIDGGENWSSIYTTSLQSKFLSIECTDENTCYAVGVNGTIAKSIDGGITWAPQYSGTTETLRKVMFTDINVGYIVGDNGVILTTTNSGGPTPIAEKEMTSDCIIYPNPCNDKFVIDLGALSVKNIYINLINTIGAKVKTEMLIRGKNEMNISGLQSGVYSYQIISGDQLMYSGMIVKD